VYTGKYVYYKMGLTFIVGRSFSKLPLIVFDISVPLNMLATRNPRRVWSGTDKRPGGLDTL